MALDHWFQGPLAEDINHYLSIRETQLPHFCAQSPQIAYRRFLVDWVAVICDKHQLCFRAKHLAVTLMDYLMDQFDIDNNMLKLVAMGCILVAAKFEEGENQIPKYSELNRHVSNSYSKEEFLQMELMVLRFFQWNIGLPTAAHFIEYFLMYSLSPEDCNRIDEEQARGYLVKYSNYFMEISLQDHQYREYKPSQIAAACVAAARLCLHINPPWTSSLCGVTSYTFTDLRPIIEPMLMTHQLDKQAQQHQSLVVTVCSPPVTPSPQKETTCLNPVYF